MSKAAWCVTTLAALSSQPLSKELAASVQADHDALAAALANRDPRRCRELMLRARTPSLGTPVRPQPHPSHTMISRHVYPYQVINDDSICPPPSPRAGCPDRAKFAFNPLSSFEPI